MWIIAPDGSTMVNTDNCAAIKMMSDNSAEIKDYEIYAEFINGGEVNYIDIIRHGTYAYAAREMSRIETALINSWSTCRLKYDYER